MNREVHVRLREGVRVRLPRATRRFRAYLDDMTIDNATVSIVGLTGISAVILVTNL